MATSSTPRPSAKAWKSLRKAYAALGYINFTPVPNTTADDEKRTISLEIDLDEGKQFYVRRIEFQGNTTTRDKVIRRELALEEGQIYNGNLWELSLLRLNQLQYFDQLKPEQDSEIKQNPQDGTVDITLKVKEKGKNSHRPDRRRQRTCGRLHRHQLHHQQPVRQRREPDPAVPGRPVSAQRAAVVHAAVSVRPPVAVWLDGVSHQLQLQSGGADLSSN